MDRPRRFQSNRGISIWELVAILAVIAFFAILLVPTFTRSREGTPRPPCQNNIKELALALNTYWIDYDNHLPSSMLVNGSKKWNRDDFVRFATVSGNRPAKGRPRTLIQVLYGHMKSKDIMFCPSDPVDRNDPNSRVSYFWKTAVDKAWYGVGCKKPCRKDTDFVYNSDQVAFYEHRAFHWAKPGGWFRKSVKAPPLRNGAQINVAFLDTHVKCISLVDATSGNPAHPASQSNGEPMYFNYDNAKPPSSSNPPLGTIPARGIDPARYSDRM